MAVLESWYNKLIEEDYFFLEKILHDVEETMGDGDNIDYQITSSTVDVPIKETDGLDHSTIDVVECELEFNMQGKW